MGRLVSGGRAYAIGGNCSGGSYPRQVWICDMNQGSPNGDIVHLDGDGDDDDYDDAQVASIGPCYGCPWQQGPDLRGAKARPLVFAFRGKIYALSGGGDHYRECHEQGPVFEFLEEEAPDLGWKTLPHPYGYDPPSSSYYYYVSSSSS
ncbi:hypothetical protein Tsubulata_011743 [Turnera subulata]|uniref:Uncharacterized protein n=1 Tax=Turnera subulata TaxID=218843 RepID=A0A9Q0GF52_9ROSI|nr:hypothetical protein Tsubulata_011743 [Turnera subulata]